MSRPDRPLPLFALAVPLFFIGIGVFVAWREVWIPWKSDAPFASLLPGLFPLVFSFAGLVLFFQMLAQRARAKRAAAAVPGISSPFRRIGGADAAGALVFSFVWYSFLVVATFLVAKGEKGPPLLFLAVFWIVGLLPLSHGVRALRRRGGPAVGLFGPSGPFLLGEEREVSFRIPAEEARTIARLVVVPYVVDRWSEGRSRSLSGKKPPLADRVFPPAFEADGRAIPLSSGTFPLCFPEVHGCRDPEFRLEIRMFLRSGALRTRYFAVDVRP